MLPPDPLADFHPAISAWFRDKLGEPTPVQERAWDAIRGGTHTLIAAPTGSGKTLAAFLTILNHLVEQSCRGDLPQATTVLYVSPLKALSNDVEKNLNRPLREIQDAIFDSELRKVDIRVAVRTGDTPPSERAAMIKHNPHILITTPESLFLLLTSKRGRDMLKNVRTVIVDEIHALVGEKRGAHLALSLERLQELAGDPLVRIGLSATQKPIEEVSRFLTGGAACAIIDTGHRRKMDLQVEIPESPLTAVMANEVWDEVYARIETADRGTSDHPSFREYPPAGRADGPPPQPIPGRGQGRGPSRQPVAGSALRRRTAPQIRQARRTGGDRIPGARHRYRFGGPGDPDRLPAIHFRPAPARRPFRPCRGRHAQRAAVPVDPGRTDRSHRLAGRRAPRRAGHAVHSRQAPGHPGPADRGRNRLPGMGRRTALPGLPARLPLSRSDPGRVPGNSGDAGRGFHHPAGTARGPRASGRGERSPARTPGRAPHGPDQRRRHPGHLRLRSEAGAG